MRRDEAIARVLAAVGDDDLVVCANGHIGREACAARDRAGNFYMIGSMGLASSIGLGLALAGAGAAGSDRRRVVVLDGDGNVLMALGTLASVAAAAPRRFLHVCLDNGEYTSTGGQATISRRVPLEEVARAAGYALASRVDNADALDRAVRGALRGPSPAFLLVKVAPGHPKPLAPRIPLDPPALARRFREAAARGLGGGGAAPRWRALA